MTPEEIQQQIEQIEKWQESRRGLVDSARKHADLDASHPEIRMHGYIDFLLCLVSQETVSVRAAAEAATLRLCKAQEVITGLFDLRVPKQREGFQIWLEDAMTGVATSMRSACVERVKDFEREHRLNMTLRAHRELKKLLSDLLELTVQEQEAKQS